LSPGVVDEAVYRLDKAFHFFSIFSVLICAFPVVVLLDSIKGWNNLVEEGNHGLLKEHFSLISFSYFAVFEVLIHGDTP
jgi:hypothetical protein